MNMRLDKLLCDAGWGSRADMHAAVRAGRVTVDGAAVTDSAQKVESDTSTVCIDGQDADYREHDYLMMHKPAGVVSATEDPNETTVIDLLPPRYRRRGLFPAGRLDKDTTGLIVLTNDGRFGHAMTAPGRRVPRVYEVTVDGPLTAADADAFLSGIHFSATEHCLPATLNIVQFEGNARALVTIFEGKYHQVKRMFLTRERRVIALKRLSHGPFQLDEALGPGWWRHLYDHELAAFNSVFSKQA